MKSVDARSTLPAAPPAAQPLTLHPGDRRNTAERMPHIPDFRLIELCGRGGSGSVYLGVDRDGVRRAVRILRSDACRGEVRERECVAVARYRNLAHGNEHLIDILYSGHVRSTSYYVLPLADSASARQYRYSPLTLAEKLRRGGCPTGEKLRIMRDIVDAVSFLHAHGVAHLDLKPENILFVGGVLKVADPGLLAPAGRFSAGGTREFSPSCPRSGCRTDIYAVGMIMYCVFTEQPPEKFPELPPDWRDGFHSELNRMILKCCMSDGNGYRSAAELAADLAALEIPPPRWHDLRLTWHRVRRSSELWLVISALLFGLASCRHTKPHGAEPVSTASLVRSSGSFHAK